MSNTPRTDELKRLPENQGRLTSNPFEELAMELERELAATIENHRRDKERLDWLDGLRKDSPWEWSLSLHDPQCVFFGKNCSSGHKTARSAIDAAMEKNP